MQSSDPAYLAIGTEVSAKYKGAFCEARVRKVDKEVKVRVNFKGFGLGNATLSDEYVKADVALTNGLAVRARHPDKQEYMDAVITQIKDQSKYTVTFNDGDIATLRRTALCMKSGKHYNASESLDKLPLTHPEHFSTPVGHGAKGRRRNRSGAGRKDGSGDEDSSSESEESASGVSSAYMPHISRVVWAENTDGANRRSSGKGAGGAGKDTGWFPALIVAPSASPLEIDTKEDFLIKSFRDGKLYTVAKKDTNKFCKETAWKSSDRGMGDITHLKDAITKAITYIEKDELPPLWDRDSIFNMGGASSEGGKPGTGKSGETEGETTSATESSEESEFDDDLFEEDTPESKDFLVAELYKHMDERGTPINTTPAINGKDLDLYRLYRMVTFLGGHSRVTNKNSWKMVAKKLDAGFDTTSFSVNQVRVHYLRYLQSFEELKRTLGCTLVTDTPSAQRQRQQSGISGGSSSSRLQMRGAHKLKKSATDLTSHSAPSTPPAAPGGDKSDKEETASTGSGTGGRKSAASLHALEVASGGGSSKPASPKPPVTSAASSSQKSDLIERNPASSATSSASTTSRDTSSGPAAGAKKETADKRGKWSVAKSDSSSSAASSTAGTSGGGVGKDSGKESSGAASSSSRKESQILKQKTESKMTTRPRRDSSTSLAAAMQVKAQKDNISGEVTSSKSSLSSSSAASQKKEEAFAAAASEAKKHQLQIRMDRLSDKEVELETSPTKKGPKGSASADKGGGKDAATASTPAPTPSKGDLKGSQGPGKKDKLKKAAGEPTSDSVEGRKKSDKEAPTGQGQSGPPSSSSTDPSTAKGQQQGADTKAGPKQPLGRPPKGSRDLGKGGKRPGGGGNFDSKQHLAPNVVVAVGDKIKVFYQRDEIYGAKVIKIQEPKESHKLWKTDDSEQQWPRFLVHYAGWNSRYDEWIPRSRIAEAADSHVATAEELKAKLKTQSGTTSSSSTTATTSTKETEKSEKTDTKASATSAAPGSGPASASSSRAGTPSRSRTSSPGLKRHNSGRNKNKSEPVSNKSAGESGGGNVYTDSGDESSESVISSSNDGSAVSGRKSSRLNVIKNEKTTGSSSPRETSSAVVTTAPTSPSTRSGRGVRKRGGGGGGGVAVKVDLESDEHDVEVEKLDPGDATLNLEPGPGPQATPKKARKPNTSLDQQPGSTSKKESKTGGFSGLGKSAKKIGPSGKQQSEAAASSKNDSDDSEDPYAFKEPEEIPKSSAKKDQASSKSETGVDPEATPISRIKKQLLTSSREVSSRFGREVTTPVKESSSSKQAENPKSKLSTATDAQVDQEHQPLLSKKNRKTAAAAAAVKKTADNSEDVKTGAKPEVGKGGPSKDSKSVVGGGKSEVKSEPPPSEPDESGDAEGQPIRGAERLAAKKKAKEAAAAAAVVKTEEGEGAEGATEESSDGKPVLQLTKKQQELFPHLAAIRTTSVPGCPSASQPQNPGEDSKGDVDSKPPPSGDDAIKAAQPDQQLPTPPTAAATATSGESKPTKSSSSTSSSHSTKSQQKRVASPPPAKTASKPKRKTPSKPISSELVIESEEDESDSEPETSRPPPKKKPALSTGGGSENKPVQICLSPTRSAALQAAASANPAAAARGATSAAAVTSSAAKPTPSTNATATSKQPPQPVSSQSSVSTPVPMSSPSSTVSSSAGFPSSSTSSCLSSSMSPTKSASSVTAMSTATSGGGCTTSTDNYSSSDNDAATSTSLKGLSTRGQSSLRNTKLTKSESNASSEGGDSKPEATTPQLNKKEISSRATTAANKSNSAKYKDNAASSKDGAKDTSSPPTAGAADETCGEGDEALELACEETMLPGSPVMADTAAGSAPSAASAASSGLTNVGDLEDEDDDSQPLVMDLKDKSDKESTSESLSNKEECPQSAITAGGESSVTSGGLVTQATPKKSEMPFASVPLSLSSSSPPEEKLNTANNRCTVAAANGNSKSTGSTEQNNKKAETNVNKSEESGRQTATGSNEEFASSRSASQSPEQAGSKRTKNSGINSDNHGTHGGGGVVTTDADESNKGDTSEIDLEDSLSGVDPPAATAAASASASGAGSGGGHPRGSSKNDDVGASGTESPTKGRSKQPVKRRFPGSTGSRSPSTVPKRRRRTRKSSQSMGGGNGASGGGGASGRASSRFERTSRKNYKDMMDGDTDTEADNTAEEGGGGLGGGGNKEDLKRLGTLDDDALRALTQRSPNAKSSRFNFYVNFDPAMDSAERISRLQTSIEDLKRTYVTVKNKLAVLDRRRRKKITRKTGPGSRNNLDSSDKSMYGSMGSGGSGASGGPIEASA